MSYFRHAFATAGSIAPVLRSHSGIGLPSGPFGLNTASNENNCPPWPVNTSMSENFRYSSARPPTGRESGRGLPSASVNMFDFGSYRLIFWKSRKSTGSGEVDQHPPKKSGYATWSHRLDHPPDECPVTNRAPGWPMPRYVF